MYPGVKRWDREKAYLTLINARVFVFYLLFLCATSDEM
jgi:hypothetical protein